MPAFTQDQIVAAIIAEGKTARTSGAGYLQHPVITPKGIAIAIATGLVESGLKMYANEGDPESLNFPHDAVSTDANSVGVFQQRAPWWGTAAERMDPALSAAMFYNSLYRQRIGQSDYNTDANSAGGWAQMVQQSAFPDRYDELMGQAWSWYNKVSGGVAPGTPASTPPLVPTDPNRPDYNEYAVWSSNSQDRGNTTIDLFLLHTQEGGGGNDAADNLAHWLDANGVSYHYTVSQASDGGVTVCDVVDTDYAAWAVLSANDRSINLCFAGSSVNWDRAAWMRQSKAITAAAYIAVQDCQKYGITARVIPPPYAQDPPGISDHKYVTEHLHDGTHSDVGPNFPWDFFTSEVERFVHPPATTTPPPVVVPPPVVPPPTTPPGDTTVASLDERPHAPTQSDDLLGHLLSLRAEHLVTQAILTDLAAALGRDVNAIRASVLGSL